MGKMGGKEGGAEEDAAWDTYMSLRSAAKNRAGCHTNEEASRRFEMLRQRRQKHTDITHATEMFRIMFARP